jgi:hypothetical protein
LSILWILDTRKSALTFSARLNSKPGDEYLFGTEYPTLCSLIKKIVESESSYVVFAWRQPLLDAQSSAESLRLLNLIPLRRKIFLHIADLASIGNDAFNLEIAISNFVDGVLFTSNHVRTLYSDDLPTSTCTAFLYDKIDDSNRSTLNKTYAKRSGQVIWVGNSQWGRRSGHIDHKGYQEIIIPLKKYCESIDCGHKYVLFDSAKKHIPNDQVLLSIRESEFLLMPSRSEGTGMPLLEALALRTVPLSSATGIAPEIFHGDLSKLSLPRSLDAYKSALHDQSFSDLIDSDRLGEAFDAHKSKQIDPETLFVSISCRRRKFVASEINTFSKHLYLARFVKSKLKTFISH